MASLVAERGRGRQFGSTLQASKQLYLECRHLSIIYLSTFVPRQSRMSPRRRPVVSGILSVFYPPTKDAATMLQGFTRVSEALAQTNNERAEEQQPSRRADAT